MPKVEEPSQAIPSGHLAGLDGIRGVAILLVMALHFVGDAPAHTIVQRLMVRLAGYGLFGVDLFFVLSGFLITGLLVEAKGSPGYFRNFYARRTLRIFPLYYFVLACLLLVLPALTQPTPWLDAARSQQVWLWTYTSNFYIASTSSWASLTYFSHFWSLAIEEQFYLVWPVVVFACSTHALERVCVGVILFAAVLRVGLALAGVSELSISVLTPCRVDTLCMGAFIALRIRRRGSFKLWVQRSGVWAVALALALLCWMALGALAGSVKPVFHQLRGTLLAAFFGALILVALKPPTNVASRALQGRFLRFFGKYSYGLYVYHGLLTWYLMESRTDERLFDWLGDPWLVIGGRVVVGVGVSLTIAVLSYHLLEKRFLQLKRHFEVQHGPQDATRGLGRASVRKLR